MEAVEEIEDLEEYMITQLDQLGLSLSASRSEAIAGRKNSGIEDEWLGDEEHYEGIDDANRHESALDDKPAGRPDSRHGQDDETQSNIFINITRPYVDGAGARVGDMLLPVDDRPWAIEPTPMPEIIGMTESKLPKAIREELKAKHGEDKEAYYDELKTLPEKAEEFIKEAREAAEKAQLQIEDWHVECQYTAEVRAVIDDSAKVGTGILKGPVPAEFTNWAWSSEKGEIVDQKDIRPVSVRVNYWNVFPDPAFGS